MVRQVPFAGLLSSWPWSRRVSGNEPVRGVAWPLVGPTLIAGLCAATPAALRLPLSNERTRASATAIAKGNRLLRQVMKIVTHPATIITGVVCGLLFGFFLPKQAHALVPFAKL